MLNTIQYWFASIRHVSLSYQFVTRAAASDKVSKKIISKDKNVNSKHYKIFVLNFVVCSDKPIFSINSVMHPLGEVLICQDEKQVRWG